MSGLIMVIENKFCVKCKGNVLTLDNHGIGKSEALNFEFTPKQGWLYTVVQT